MRKVQYTVLSEVPAAVHRVKLPSEQADLSKLFEELINGNIRVAQIRWVGMWINAGSCCTTLRRFIRKFKMPFVVYERGINVYLIRLQT